MYPVRPTVGIEPTNPYEKAKQDLIAAYNSFAVLTPLQKGMLVKELFGAANVNVAIQLMQQMLCGR